MTCISISQYVEENVLPSLELLTFLHSTIPFDVCVMRLIKHWMIFISFFMRFRWYVKKIHGLFSYNVSVRSSVSFGCIKIHLLVLRMAVKVNNGPQTILKKNTNVPTTTTTQSQKVHTRLKPKKTTIQSNIIWYAVYQKEP